MRLHQLEDEGVRQARLALDRARTAWREHAADQPGPGRTACVQCYIVGETRRGAAETDLCPVGRPLRRERDRAAEQLRRERADAARPNPDQYALFDLPESSAP